MAGGGPSASAHHDAIHVIANDASVEVVTVVAIALEGS
jgi:hypothetical protein